MSAGAAVLRMSSNGRCCSIVWPEARRYAVYAQGGSDDWHKVDEESGTSVAWAGASSTYAVLHQPRVKMFVLVPNFVFISFFQIRYCTGCVCFVLAKTA